MKTMLFGPLEHMLEVPYPQSDMGWDSTRTTEDTDLLSGGKHVYVAPTPYHSYSLDYRGGTAGLKPIVDLYNGVYGNGPFYLTEFNFTDGNILPTRWATGSMLAAVSRNWCAPTLVATPAALSGDVSAFKNLGAFPDVGAAQIVPAPPGKALSLYWWGAVTGGAGIHYSKLVSGVWSAPTLCAPLTEVSIAADTVTAIKLELFCPNGGTLNIDHINLSTLDGTVSRQAGDGIGAVRFSSDLSGNIQTKRFDRIGLSLDIIEIES